MLRISLFVLLAASLPAAAGAEPEGARMQYVGGTVSSLPAKSDGRIDLSGNEMLRLRVNRVRMQIPYERINLLEYGQKVNRRIAESILISPLLLLSKKRKHFLTLGYTDEAGRQQALVFQLHKGAVREVLAGLEARTGRRVEYQDPEARKGGKG